MSFNLNDKVDKELFSVEVAETTFKLINAILAKHNASEINNEALSELYDFIKEVSSRAAAIGYLNAVLDSEEKDDIKLVKKIVSVYATLIAPSKWAKLLK